MARKKFDWADIPEEGQPQLGFNNARVLSVAHVGASDSTGFLETSGEQAVFAKFAYLNPGDCGFFEVLCEGLELREPAVTFKAPVIGGRPADTRSFTGPLTAPEQLIVPGLDVPWIVAAYLSLEPSRRSVTPLPSGFEITIVGTALLLFLLATFGACVFLTRRYLLRLHHSRVPDAAPQFLTGAV